MHVLVCDDDKATRLVARRLIEQHFGWRVSEASDGVEGLRQLGREQFSLILLDIDMPIMSGLEMLEELRQSDTTRHVPVVILSGQNDPQRIMPLMKLGIADYMLKPIHHATTVTKLEKVARPLPADEEGANAIRLAPDVPALLVDGDPAFSIRFVKETQGHGTVTRTDCGAAALMEYRRSPVSLVFVGTNLGIVTERRLVAKIRELRGSKVRIVRITTDQEVVERGLFDATMNRTDSPEQLAVELQPFVIAAGH
jgi:two-component system chemotaxis response regulator CheY